MRSTLNQVNNWADRAKNSKYDARVIAASLSISVRQLERYFKWRFKSTPQQWLNNCRTFQALSLLDGSKSVKEVSRLLGYKQASHFSRVFKAATGVTPSRISWPENELNQKRGLACKLLR